MDPSLVPVPSVEAATTMLPAGDFLLVTITDTNGVVHRSDAVILRPDPLDQDFEQVDEFDGTPCIWLRWVETADPFHTGHPGSAWPVQRARRHADGSVTLLGERGSTTFRALGVRDAARLGGEVDAVISASLGEPGAWTLPMNRKERFYTGTVLPAIVAGDRLATLERLLHLCGLADTTVGDPPTVQFFTEYSFAESVFTETDRKHFAHRPTSADTPDVVIRGPGWLLAIEAKMFHRPSAGALQVQYERQSLLVEYWAARFGANPVAVRHVLLLPERLAQEVGTSIEPAPVVTWEQLVDAYQDVAPAYWLDMLRTALSRYDVLASKDATWGQNAQSRLTGGQIVAAHRSGEVTFPWMGRAGGVHGSKLVSDISTGSWHARSYEVRSIPPPTSNANWFSVADFVSALEAASKDG